MPGQKAAGPPCGNNPRHPLTPGDRQAVDEFRTYLADRAAVRDKTALDLGRDLLRDGLDAFLHRLVGPQNAARILGEAAAHTRVEALREAADAITAVIEADRAYSPRRSNDRAALGAARELVLKLIDQPRP